MSPTDDGMVPSNEWEDWERQCGKHKFGHVGTVTGRITSSGRSTGMMEVHKRNYGNLAKERKSKMTEEKYTKTFYVAGVKFRKDWRKTLIELQEGQKLELVPEPTNRFDPNAIQLWANPGVDPIMLGFVPAKTGEAAEVSILLDAGKELIATLKELQPEFEPWKALLVEVREV